MTKTEMEIKKMLIINEMRGYAENYELLYERYMDPNDLDDTEMASGMMDIAQTYMKCIDIVKEILK